MLQFVFLSFILTAATGWLGSIVTFATAPPRVRATPSSRVFSVPDVPSHSFLSSSFSSPTSSSEASAHLPLPTSSGPAANASSNAAQPSATSSNSQSTPLSSTHITSIVSSTLASTSSGSQSPSSSSTTSAGPTQTVDPSTLQDIDTIHVRRLPFIVAGVSGASNIAPWLSTLGSNGRWPDSEIDYTTGCNAQRANWPAEDHWKRISTFAAAFHGGLKGADQYVNDSDFRNSITLAMDFWFENDFTDPSCIDSGGTPSCPCGTPGFWNTNWFSNVIGIPQLVGESCLLLNDTLTDTQLSNCTHITSRAYGTFGQQINGLGTLTGSNTLDVASVGIDLGLLTVNVLLITDAYNRVHNEVVVENAVKADSIRPDGSFGQHGGIIYNGNYGKDYTNDVLALEIEAGGTQFEAGAVSKDAFASLIDGDQWMIYRNILTGVLHWDFSVLGRFISFPVADNQATASIKINITEFQALGEEWGSDTLTGAFINLSANTTNANAGSLNGNRMFYDNDYMVQRGDGYVTTLRMYSNRTQNTECVNSQSPFGFHLSDGTVYTYLTGNEYEDIAASWDWNLIPGITVDYAATPLTCDSTQFTGIESFVGGASDGQIGVAAMRFTNPLTKALSWQKAWFFLDDDVQHVMINSIISDTNATVFSVLDQRRHVGDILVDGFPAFGGNFTSADSLWHGDVGYMFSNGRHPASSLSIEAGPRTGNWSALGISTQPPPTVDLFSAWLLHNDLSSSTSYTVFPSTDYYTFLRKTYTTDLTELQNDGDISAILDAAHQTVMVVFWQAAGGQITLPAEFPIAPITVQSDRGLAVMVRLNTWIVTVADPAQSFIDAQLTFTLGTGRTPQGWGQARVKQLPFVLPNGGLSGSSVVKPLLD